MTNAPGTGRRREQHCRAECAGGAEFFTSRCASPIELARSPTHTSPRIFKTKMPSKNALGSLIFLSRWLQAPLYFGLIIAQGVYVYRFLVELWHLIAFALLGHDAPASVAAKDTETIVMLTVLGLIDVVMIANLLIMVIVGGYETFVSRLN